jgi:hypothetical protein
MGGFVGDKILDRMGKGGSGCIETNKLDNQAGRLVFVEFICKKIIIILLITNIICPI